MILLRSLLYQLFLVGSSVMLSIAILLAARTKSAQSVSRLARTWGRLNLDALRVICHLDYRLQGFENLPSETAIVLCKHQSAWETIALRALLPLEQSWILKQELMNVPFFGWAMSCLQPIAIDRSAGRRAVAQVIREGERRLNAGRWVIVFPEGTRVAPGTRHPYAIGGALLAERTGYPVIPIAHNAGNFWGRRRFIKHPGTIDLVVGPILDSRGRKATEINATVEQWIETTVDALSGHDGAHPTVSDRV
jgi:1-acyl-sn-glycerol-3-phosphate acyltransferase